MIRDKLREIIQSSIWIAIFLGIPSATLTLGTGPDREIPTWAAIMLGAIVGGIVATPANRIGDSSRQILTIMIERQAGKPEEDEQDSRKAEEYIQQKTRMRHASTWQLVKWNSRGTLRSFAFFSAGIASSIAAAAGIAALRGEAYTWPTVGTLAILATAGFIALFTAFLIFRVAASKVYFR